MTKLEHNNIDALSVNTSIGEAERKECENILRTYYYKPLPDEAVARISAIRVGC